MYKIIFPPTHTNEGNRNAWCRQAKKTLIDEHNIMGAKLNAGEITQQQFDTYVKNIYIPKQRQTVLPTLHTLDMIARFTQTKWTPSIELNLELIEGVYQVKYPRELNINNEGSRLSFLASFKEVIQQNGYIDKPQWEAVELEEQVVIVLAENSTFHNVDTERDIIQR